MIVGVESHPNLLPAECIFSGHGSGSCDKFIRLQLPENYYYDNILISEHFFKQMADEMGYVKKTERQTVLEELREEARVVAPNLASLLERIDSLRSELQYFEACEQRITKFATSFESFRDSKRTDKQAPSGKSSRVPAATVPDHILDSPQDGSVQDDSR